MELRIPDRCKACPQVLEQLNHIKEHREHVKHDLETAMSDDIDEIARFIKQSVSVIGEDLETVSSEEIAKQYRKSTALRLERDEETIDDHERDLNGFVANCLGPLALRASRDNRRVYTVRVCTSPAAPTDAPYEAVTVDRTRR